MTARRCIYRHAKFADGRCPRTPVRGWTTCLAHYSAGKSLRQVKGR